MKWFPFLIFMTTMILAVTANGQKISRNLNLADTTQQHMLFTQRGDVLVGRVDGLTADSVYFSIRGRFPMTYAKSEITWLGPADEAPNRTGSTFDNWGGIEMVEAAGDENLLYSPTAFRLGKKQVEIRNVDLLYNEVSAGIGDNVQIGGGAVLPIAFFLKAKAGFDVSNLVHLGVGANFLLPIIVDADGVSTHVFGIATIGEPGRFLNLTAGYGLSLTDSYDPEFIITLGGGLNFLPNWRISLDGMFLPGEGALQSLMFSWFKGKNRFEMGAVFILDDFIPFPIISYARRF